MTAQRPQQSLILRLQCPEFEFPVEFLGINAIITCRASANCNSFVVALSLPIVSDICVAQLPDCQTLAIQSDAITRCDVFALL
jgi:hypothetical protein